MADDIVHVVLENAVHVQINFPKKLAQAVNGYSGVSLALPGKVCWQRPEDGDTWQLGCLCSQQVDWETLGELFLTGVLATDESAG